METYEQIMKALGSVSKNLEMLTALQTKGVTGTPNAQYPHGAGGLFSQAGIDDVVINASLVPRGLESELPVFPTVYTDPITAYITGFESDGSSEPSGVCENCPGGVVETCHQVATFGRICRESQEIEINRVFQMLNRGETTPLRVLGSVLGPGAFVPDSTDTEGWVNLVTQTAMTIVGVEFQRSIIPMVWTGNPANNTAGGGYKEFPGLDIQISTGKVDAVTGVACGALDSDVKDFNYNIVDAANPDIVEYVSMMEFYLRHIADRTGMSPVEWVLVGRPELFFELSAIWPCRYLTHRCTVIDTAHIDTVPQVDSADAIAMRDAMRNGNYLTVNGRNIRFIQDDGIYEENSTTSAELAAGEFASDLYFVPLTARGMPVTYMEHLDYRKANPDIAMLNNMQNFWSTDQGRFMWNLQQQAWCYVVMGKVEPRVILKTPQIAGRIQNIKYSPLQHLRSPFDDSPYFAKGGNEEYPGPSWYTQW